MTFFNNTLLFRSLQILLCSQNLKLILGEDSTNTEVTLIEKFAKNVMPKEAKTAVQDQKQIQNQRFQTLFKILEPVKDLLNPSPDSKMLGTLKENNSTKIQLSLAIDSRLLKITLLLESPIISDVGFQGDEERRSIN